MLQVGCAAGFLIPPLLVPNSDDLAEVGHDLSIMFYIWAGVTTSLFLLIILGKDIQFSCSCQQSRKFQLLIKTKCCKIKTFHAFKLSTVVFIVLINVKMLAVVEVVTFKSRKNFMLS